MNNHATWTQQSLDRYTIWSHTVTHQQWLNLSIAWSEAEATVLETATVSNTGQLQCHILDHRTRIHAIYTLSDVPTVRTERNHA
jgi:hypothetical protein